MKKFLIVLIVFCLCFLWPTKIFVDAETEEFRVCINQTTVFAEPNLQSEKLETLVYGTKVVAGELVNGESTNLKFYEIIKDEEVYGYVISTTISNENEIKYNLQPNANLNKDSQVFAGTDEEKLIISGEEISLEAGTKIKLLEKFNTSEKYSKIAFEKDGEILTGFVLTENVHVYGFNYYFLIAIFLIVIIASTVIPIVYKNWKKHKNLNQSTSKK
ncbi:MAG: hypothetical protein J5779_03315 [Clostridia bacterium]|nr:hypothetical protein [Clostridia bacterium]